MSQAASSTCQSLSAKSRLLKSNMSDKGEFYGSFELELPSDDMDDIDVDQLLLTLSDYGVATRSITSPWTDHTDVLQESANNTVKVKSEIQPPELESEEIPVVDREETEPNQSLPKKDSDHPRFRHMDDNELNELAKARYSEATKRNTQWAIKLFQDWCCETYGEPASLSQIPVDELNQKLRRFYAVAAPKQTESRKTRYGSDECNAEYHRNTMKNVRGALNRHFKDIGRDIDIVKDRAFTQANDMLSAKLKHNLKTGKSRPTEHKPIIPRNDLAAINLYLKNDNPVCLRYRVWYILTIQFVSRGLEFHPQLKLDSFKFDTDSNGEYAQLKHEVKEKQFQGGTTTPTNEEGVGKKMYATGGEDCPVKHLKCFISKCDPGAPALFCTINKGHESADPDKGTVSWYTCTPVKKRQFQDFMTDICRKSGVPRYTPHSLRATATQALNDAGVELRHIMFMTGHQTEAAVRSYSRGVTNDQKMEMSKVLTKLAMGETVDNCSPSTSAAISTLEKKCPQVPVLDNLDIRAPFPSGFQNNAFTNCYFTFNNDKQ